MDADTFSLLLEPTGRALLDELRDVAPDDELGVATRLRRTHPPELVAAALTQARLRQRAVAKFGARDAARMYFTPEGVEQSTRTELADHRAARLARLGVRTAVDLCCGIGGDALALARAGIRVHAVDASPLACAVARANAVALGLDELLTVECADVTHVPLGEADSPRYDAVFVDPGRRGGRGRIFYPEAYSPPLSWAVEAATRAPYAALKVAPGIPHEAVPAGAEAEWVSFRGDVKEAVLWFGASRGAARRATLLPQGAELLGDTAPTPPVGAVGRYLYEPDGAVIRSHLVAQAAQLLGGRLVDPTIAYVTTDEPVTSPFATGYTIDEVLPFNLKRLRALLRERDVGRLTVKKRGSAVEPEELRRKLKLRGGAAATVFLTRLNGAPSVLVGAPLG